jgi:hypothetical protein
VSEPVAVGQVLALLSRPDGRVVAGSAVRGQLYVSGRQVVVLRRTDREALLDRLAVAALALSLLLLPLALAWSRPAVVWAAAALQAVFWLTRPVRLRHQVAQPLGAGGLEAALRAGRAAIAVPASALTRLVPPPPRGMGARRPARLEMADGAVELWLGEAAFLEVRRALEGG